MLIFAMDALEFAAFEAEQIAYGIIVDCTGLHV